MSKKSITSFFAKSDTAKKASNLERATKHTDSVKPVAPQSNISSTTKQQDNGLSNSNNSVTSKASNTSTAAEFVQFIPDKQFKFPWTDYGERSRRCQHNWFEDFNWLHYDVDKDAVLCAYCIKHFDKLTEERTQELAFISDGFRNWKKSPKSLSEHAKSKPHLAAHHHEIVVPQCRDVGEMLDSNLEKSRKEERQYLKIVMENTQFLSRQGLAFRGSDDLNDNFTQLLLLRANDNEWMRQRVLEKVPGKAKYTHHVFQDDLLKLMSNQVLRKKLYDVNNSKMFSIMCDEYTDTSNKEQLSLCTRWIDDELNANEDFLEFYQLTNIKSDTIVKAITDRLTRLSLPISDLKGQTFDGASNMMGKKSGVAAQIKKLQPKALETHCHGHSLNLSIKDVSTSNRLLKSVLGTVCEIVTLIKYSPKRENILGSVQENLELESDEPENFDSIAKLCLTRWTVRSTALQKIIANYDPLSNVWDICLDENLDTETRSRIIGCRSQMRQFEFYYGLNLSHRLYSLTDNLSKALQRENLSALESVRITSLTVTTLENMRNGDSADLFFDFVVKKSEKHNFVNRPSLPRKRKNPNYKLLSEYFVVERPSTSQPYRPTSCKEHYRVLYLQI